ncbi:MAG: transporter, partial [Solirubrobacterales bacterium]|nr:transporter [Solirubrobacterales bacterium]
MTPHDNPHHARRWAILAILGLAQLMVVLDATIVNIALPSAQASLGFSDESRQWIVTAYALAFGSLLLLGGRIGDLVGRKTVFIVGLIGFALASAIGGAAGSFGVLVGARALQGVFGALLAPAALSLLTTTFVDPKERNTAFGVFGAIAGSGAAVGLLLGGVLTEYLSWRWCLYVNLVFAAVAAGGAWTLLHNQVPAERPRLDIPGTITASTGLFGLVYGFSHAETNGWTSPLTLVALGAAAVLLVAFVALQHRVAHPLLPLHVVLDRTRGGSYLALALAGAGIFGVFLFLTYYLQQNLGFSPIRTGLAFLPMTTLIMITATVATTKLVPRLGARPMVVTGMALGVVGMVYLAQLDVGSAYATGVLPALLIMGPGLGLIFATCINNATAGVEAKDAGVASATVNTMQQVGGSVGTALLSTLAASASDSFLAGRAPSPAVLAQASIESYTTVFWWAGAIFALGMVACGLLLRGGPAPEPAPGAAPAL